MASPDEEDDVDGPNLAKLTMEQIPLISLLTEFPAFSSPLPVPQRIRRTSFCEGTCTYWTVSAKKWVGNNKHVVSPHFEQQYNQTHERVKFKMWISIGKIKAKESNARVKENRTTKQQIKGTVGLKCLDQIKSDAGEMTFSISVGSRPANLERHDFAERRMWTSQEQLDFAMVLEQGLMTFDVCLEVYTAVLVPSLPSGGLPN